MHFLIGNKSIGNKEISVTGLLNYDKFGLNFVLIKQNLPNSNYFKFNFLKLFHTLPLPLRKVCKTRMLF